MTQATNNNDTPDKGGKNSSEPTATKPSLPSKKRTGRNVKPAIVVKDVHEIFKVYANARMSLRERLSSFKKEKYALYHALNGVNVTIMPGERVGLIGHNGSGKSTLLKVMAKILPPDRGSVEINGRMATLLELGAGFSPELTGRENMYLNGSILGLTRAEVDESFDRIVDFAGVRDFIDSPVKNYSSGMYVRLGFAIAVHVDPDILLVDEVLAVGDQTFQERSLSRMEAFAKAGKTVVLVSHDLVSVENLCDRVIVLEHGNIVFDGPAKQGIDAYNRRVEEGKGTDTAVPELPELSTPEIEDRPNGDEKVVITDLRVTSATPKDAPPFNDPRPVPVQKEFPFSLPKPEIVLPQDKPGLFGKSKKADAFKCVKMPPGTPITIRLTAEVADNDLLKTGLYVRFIIRRTDIPNALYDARTSWQTIYLAAPPAGHEFSVDAHFTLNALSGTFAIDAEIGNSTTEDVHAYLHEGIRLGIEAPPWEFGIVPMDMTFTVTNPDGVWPPQSVPPALKDGGPAVHPNPLWPLP